MNATTPRVVQTSMQPLSSWVIVDHLDLHCKRLKGARYADKFISKVKSIPENTVANVYSQDKIVKAYPIMAWKEAGHSLIDFTANIGVPETLLTDGDGKFTRWSTEFVKYDRWMGIQLNNLEQRFP